MTRSIRLAVVPGDGIGPEVVTEGLRVLDAALAGSDTKVETTPYDLGARRWHATGETLPDAVLTELRQHDAILLGAVGDPGVPSGVLERGLLCGVDLPWLDAPTARAVPSRSRPAPASTSS